MTKSKNCSIRKIAKMVQIVVAAKDRIPENLRSYIT